VTSREHREAMVRHMERAREVVRAAVKAGHCPVCGAGLRRNLALHAWWQCEQFGADPQFRKDADKPPCSWQGFTE
jgi:uncharacterized protein (DUF983 family)